ncbi:TrbI F-type domain-containing protein [Vibrio sp. 10N.222.54.A1]|uniref:TrbI F-type domain-containing protein n=3 Tax=Vibrio cyclitrophicus TaxID=47951 RepID=A0ACD5G5G4_9VIBR|nr:MULTISPECIES: TrbI F-type domain-containing protein [Vibrio]TKF84910.1 conjugal transfer protein [Vibrio sp. F13]TKF96633.1 conjugal transfer protein [Vibrio sp. F13]
MKTSSISPSIIIMMLITATTLTSLVAVVLTTATQPQIVTFDIKQTLDSYQEALIKSGLDDNEHTSMLRTFDHQLRGILDEYAQEQNLVIVVPGAVISGTPSRTDVIQRHLINKLKGHHDGA